MKRFVLVGVVGACLLAAAALLCVRAVRRREPDPSATIDAVLAALAALPARPGNAAVEYPLAGTVFPPELPAPTFLWNCPEGIADRWVVRVELAGRAEPLAFLAETAHWRPPAEAWQGIRAASVAADAAVTVVGFRRGAPAAVTAAAATRFRTSADAVGAPILYRSVPLPFIYAVKNPDTIRWRLVDVGADGDPPIVLENLPVCGNCHSFDASGNVLGMDVDYANDKGSYAVLDLTSQTVLSRQAIITWSDYRPQDGRPTFGLLSRISPDGRYAVSTVKDRSVFVPRPGLDYSQLFFPIKGILAFYDRRAQTFASLPGADDARYVQSNPDWSPDGKWVYFCRAAAADIPEDARSSSVLLTHHLAREFVEGKRPFRFDIWRVGFNGGAGGRAEPLPGASDNGRSNYFPRASPDGKWIVFCQADNFMLLQPDSRLYIMPAEGGTPRPMRCNTGRMNSWHSWSPNGRWLVFATKLRGPYTQLCLAHVDEAGNDAPPVLLAQAVLPGRACNIPEFRNAPPASRLVLTERFLDHHNYRRQGQVLLLTGELERSVALFEKALALNDDDYDARLRLGAALAELGRHAAADAQFRVLLAKLQRQARPDKRLLFDAHCHAAALCRATGRTDQAVQHYRQALACRPDDAEVHVLLGLTHAAGGDMAAAEAVFRQAVERRPDHALARMWLGKVLADRGKPDEARVHFRAALKTPPVRREDCLLIAERLLPYRDLSGELRAFLGEYLRRNARCARGHVLLAKAYLAADDVGPAVGHLRQAHAIDPSISWIPAKIAELQQRRGKP